MKNTILAVAFLATILTSTAQETNSKITFGAKAGLNISSASIDRSYDSDVSSLTGVNVGVFSNYKFDEKFAMQAELLFSTQGYNEYLNDGGYIFDEKVMLNYINLPIVFQYSFVPKFQ